MHIAAEQPETEGGGIPVTADEMSELMYKPLRGEWGERSRDAECERIVAGIDQLITVGEYMHKRLFLLRLVLHTLTSEYLVSFFSLILTHPPVFLLQRSQLPSLVPWT